MRRLVSFIYGLAAYLACLAALLYFIGFSGNLLVPTSVDSAAGAPWVEAVVTDLLLLALFGVQHSVMARRSFKRWWTRVVPDAVERSTYLVATCAVLALMFLFWVPIPAPVVWRVDPPRRRRPALGPVRARLAAGAGQHLSPRPLRAVRSAAGLRQPDAARRARGPVQTPLLYRYVRHPLYSGLLLTFWSVPVMTAGRLLFALGSTAYILIGIASRSVTFCRQFGERYRTYREQVGMLLPHARSSGQRGSSSVPHRPCIPPISTRG
jgi:protein-S-isoprenylcysteine O-methyltransferase Ste14